jgi:hypothetical protein
MDSATETSFASDSSFSFGSDLGESRSDQGESLEANESLDVEDLFGDMKLEAAEVIVPCPKCRLEMPAELLECHGCQISPNKALCKITTTERRVRTANDVEVLLEVICSEINSALESQGEINAAQVKRIIHAVGTEPKDELVEGIMASFGKRPTEVVTLSDFVQIQQKRQIEQMNKILTEGG